MTAMCVQCGREFHRPAREDWRIKCVRCWLEAKGLRRDVRATAPDGEQLRRELCENMRPLLQLTHPDKHGGSETANKVTQWLLFLRDRIGPKS